MDMFIALIVLSSGVIAIDQHEKDSSLASTPSHLQTNTNSGSVVLTLDSSNNSTEFGIPLYLYASVTEINNLSLILNASILYFTDNGTKIDCPIFNISNQSFPTYKITCVLYGYYALKVNESPHNINIYYLGNDTMSNVESSNASVQIIQKAGLLTWFSGDYPYIKTYGEKATLSWGIQGLAPNLPLIWISPRDCNLSTSTISTDTQVSYEAHCKTNFRSIGAGQTSFHLISDGNENYKNFDILAYNYTILPAKTVLEVRVVSKCNKTKDEVILTIHTLLKPQYRGDPYNEDDKLLYNLDNYTIYCSDGSNFTEGYSYDETICVTTLTEHFQLNTSHVLRVSYPGDSDGNYLNASTEINFQVTCDDESSGIALTLSSLPLFLISLVILFFI